MNTIWDEIKKFFVNNFKNIIIGTLIMGTVLSIGVYLLNSNGQQPIEEQPTISEDIDKELDLSRKEFAYFQYYAELQDGRAFTNVAIAREFFSQESLGMDMAQETNISFDNVIFNAGIENNSVVNTEEKVNGEDVFTINIERDNTSNLVTFIVDSNDSNKNLRIAQYYFDLINNDEVPFYQNKHLFVLTEPKINENQPEVVEEVVIQETVKGISITEITFNFLLSLIIVMGVLVIKTMFSKKIVYSFSYAWDIDDQFYLFSENKQKKQELKWLIKTPESKKIILNEQNNENVKELLTNPKGIQEKNIYYINDIVDMKNEIDIEEVVIIINEHDTTRKWYNRQKKLLSMQMNLDIKIIQINK